MSEDNTSGGVRAGDTAMLPPASLIICSRNRPELLMETVTSVLEGDELPREIVIVDQSETPHPSLSMLSQRRDCVIRYVHSPGRGLSRARNEAIIQCRHELLVIIDDDMFVAADWLGAIVRALGQAGPRAVITGSVLPESKSANGGFVPALVTSPEPAVYSGPLDRDVLAGGHIAAWRSAFTEVGLFDERLGAGSAFPAADDNDLGFRLLAGGYSIVYTPQAIVYHRAWRSRRDLVNVRWRYGLGKGGFYAKHRLRRRPIRDVGRRVWGFPGRLRCDPRGALGDLAYSAGVLIGGARWMLSQRKT